MAIFGIPRKERAMAIDEDIRRTETEHAPFHPGELAAQARAGVSARGAGIRDFMPDQHRIFFALLPCLFVATRDAAGWPVPSVLSGSPGFVQSPDPVTLRIAALPAADDPIAPLLATGRPIGLLGLDLATRRRNRANGVIRAVDRNAMTVSVRQSFGNCPQYIQTRMIAAAATAQGAIEHFEAIDAEAARMIAEADTFFVASAARTDPGDGGVDISHRGGRPGFVKVDGRRLSIPDFRGNRYFNTLGNLLVEPRTALLFIDFVRGDLLLVQGTATIDWHPASTQIPRGAERLWHVDIVRGWRLRDAIPWRWSSSQYAPTTEQTGTWQDVA
jgi:predicted pyridoxine 5'-phosphate oxidase superfamily flavin-nucleotide-binding protein